MPAPKGHPPYNTKGEGGAPLLYTDEWLDQEALNLDKWIADESTIYLGRFAWMRGYDQTRMAEWAKRHKRFALSLARAHQIQEARLVERGLNGEHKEKMSQFVLCNTYSDKWKNRQETEVTGNAALSVNVMHFGLPNTPAQPVAIDVTPAKELSCQPHVEQ